MRRINIKIEDKLITKSFEHVDELDSYLVNDCGFVGIYKWDSFGVANRIWHLNVGSKLEIDGFRFSINGKRRAGNKMINNTRIGDQI